MIDEINQDTSLFQERNFASRVEAIELLDFAIPDYIDELGKMGEPAETLASMKALVEKVKSELEDIDISVFARLRTVIRLNPAVCKGIIREFFDAEAMQPKTGIAYDCLDLFIDRLISSHPPPVPTTSLEPEMIEYYKTPASIIFDLVERCQFSNRDVFYDLGSGLGQATMLVNLLTGVQATGVELEPAYCAYARVCATDLGLRDVSFIQADAREAHYPYGTVFFMFTPFTGEILRQVLARLREVSASHSIRIFTLGPCTLEMFSQDWLIAGDGKGDYGLHEFRSK